MCKGKTVSLLQVFFIYLQSILHSSRYKINNSSNEKMQQNRRVSFTCCKISVPVMPLPVILHDQVDNGAGPCPLGIWRCTEAHASAGHRDASCLQSWRGFFVCVSGTWGEPVALVWGPLNSQLCSGTAPVLGSVAP